MLRPTLKVSYQPSPPVRFYSLVSIFELRAVSVSVFVLSCALRCTLSYVNRKSSMSSNGGHKPSVHNILAVTEELQALLEFAHVILSYTLHCAYPCASYPTGHTPLLRQMLTFA